MSTGSASPRSNASTINLCAASRAAIMVPEISTLSPAFRERATDSSNGAVMRIGSLAMFIVPPTTQLQHAGPRDS